jgi:hypothetical protein
MMKLEVLLFSIVDLASHLLLSSILVAVVKPAAPLTQLNKRLSRGGHIVAGLPWIECHLL